MTTPWMATITRAAAASNGLLAALPADSRYDGVVLWLVANGLIAIVGGLIAAAISIAVFRTRLKAVDDDMGDVKEDVKGLQKDLAALTNQRTDCELRAVSQFCTRNELVRMTIDANDQNQKLVDNMSAGFAGVYKRIDAGLKDVHQRINILAPEAQGKKGA